MKENVLNSLDNEVLKVYNYLYVASIASDATKSNGNGGIIIIGMIIVIIGLVGFIITKNK